ncbi:hypothetical protein KC19_5G064200 [Ceratodon purpureus]|uniref:Uncharacterized protein n=1 Tax=Ceratodon purpureus TaxID=3225 RepID=A0A8T0HZL6_CERPU|nr:hypothetical protein KC19_5G064200 [Ceratodon purpureus]
MTASSEGGYAGACDPHRSNQPGVRTLETSPAASSKKLWWVCVNLIIVVLRPYLRCLQDAAKKVAPYDYGVRCKGTRGGIVAAIRTIMLMVQPATARKVLDTDSVAATDKKSWTNMQLIGVFAVFVAFWASKIACFLSCWKEGKDQARHDAAMKKNDDDRDTQKLEEIRKEEFPEREKGAFWHRLEELRLTGRLEPMEEKLRNLELNQRKLESDMCQMRLSNVPNAPSEEQDSFFDTGSGLARSLRGGDDSALPINAKQWETQLADPITIVVHKTSRNESEASRSDDQLCDSESYRFF